MADRYVMYGTAGQERGAAQNRRYRTISSCRSEVTFRRIQIHYSILYLSDMAWLMIDQQGIPVPASQQSSKWQVRRANYEMNYGSRWTPTSDFLPGYAS